MCCSSAYTWIACLSLCVCFFCVWCMAGDCCSSALSLWTEARGTDCNNSTVDRSSVNLPMPDESMMSRYSLDLMVHRICFANDELNGYQYAAEISVFQTDQVSGAQFMTSCNQIYCTALTWTVADCSYCFLFWMFAGWSVLRDRGWNYPVSGEWSRWMHLQLWPCQAW